MDNYRDVVSAVPTARVNVKYGNLVVDNGNELTPTQTYDKPNVSWEAEADAFYTLVLNGPDVSPELGVKEILHWLVVNIPGNDLAKGETLFQYVGTAPQEGTRLHRYIFLVYKQSGILKEETYTNMKDEKLGSLKTRASQTLASVTEQLKLGSPIAGNFFRAQYDENVPKFRVELAKKFV